MKVMKSSADDENTTNLQALFLQELKTIKVGSFTHEVVLFSVFDSVVHVICF